MRLEGKVGVALLFEYQTSTVLTCQNSAESTKLNEGMIKIIS